MRTSGNRRYRCVREATDMVRAAAGQAITDGAAFSGGDAEWNFFERLARGGMADPALLRAFLSIGLVLRRPDELIAEGTLLDRISAAIQAVGAAAVGPDREEILTALAR
jgi:hypothetical protein